MAIDTWRLEPEERLILAQMHEGAVAEDVAIVSAYSKNWSAAQTRMSRRRKSARKAATLTARSPLDCWSSTPKSARSRTLRNTPSPSPQLPFEAPQQPTLA